MQRWILPLLFLLPTTALGAVTAEYQLDSGGSSSGSFGRATSVVARGQVFLAEVSGDLSAVSLRVARNSDHTTDLVVAIHAEQDGLPAGDPLAESSFASADFQVGVARVERFTFPDSGVRLVAGTRYVITARPPTADPEESLFYLNGVSAGSADYPGGGSCFQFVDSWQTADTIWSFRVEVDDATGVAARSWGRLKIDFAH